MLSADVYDYYSGNTSFIDRGTLALTNYGFAIPATATITGVQVVVRRRYTEQIVDEENSVSQYDHYNLLVGGYPTCRTLAAGYGTWGTTPADWTIGTTTELWNTTLTPALVNAAGFGVALIAGNCNSNLYLDSVGITVHYTTGSDVTRDTALPTTAYAHPGIVNEGWDDTFGVIQPQQALTFNAVGASVEHVPYAYGYEPLDLTGFGFTIPAGATIEHIAVEAVIKSEVSLWAYWSGTRASVTASLLKGGTPTAQSTSGSPWDGDPSFYNDSAWRVFGGHPTGHPLWGMTWTPADINAATFGVRCQLTPGYYDIGDADSNPLYLDAVRVYVTYTLPAPANAHPTCAIAVLGWDD